MGRDARRHITLKRTVTIFEQPSAAFDFAMTENTRCFLSEATFKAMPTGNHYKWMLNGDSIGKGSTLNTRLKNGLYTVGLVAVSEAGCATTNTYPVRVETANQLIAPKAFSDNADGLNDAWEISGLDMAASFELVITRVQGNTVAFRSTSQTSWDGSINGTAERPAKGEHFTWVLTATDECGNRTQEGGVLLYLR